MITFEQIQKANESIKTTDIKGKEYAEVNQRIKAFRQVYPTGSIQTVMVSNENGVCVFQAVVGYNNENGVYQILGTGTAYEKESSSFINKTSYIENCETSAVGRALGMCGFGIDTSVASAEEVQNAINNQNSTETTTLKFNDTEAKATPKQIEVLKNTYKGDNLAKLLEANGITTIEELPLAKASEIIGKLKKKAEEKANG
jgi:hypothetical protein